MTPLALELMADLSVPGAFRQMDMVKTVGGDRQLLAETILRGSVGSRGDFFRAASYDHFFDLSGMTEAVQAIGEKMRADYERRGLWNSRLAFLPAENTWLEFEFKTDHGNRYRQAFHIVGDQSTRGASYSMIGRTPQHEWTYVTIGPLPLVGDGQPPHKMTEDHVTVDGTLLERGNASRDEFMLYAALAFINTPRVIGRRQHMPHERAERERLKALGLVGKFPLRAWTEITLKVALPDDRSGEPSQEAHLTGEKCLHFCRTHLRVRLGALEYVEGHWRGDPALGIKRSRYLIEV